MVNDKVTVKQAEDKFCLGFADVTYCFNVHSHDLHLVIIV